MADGIAPNQQNRSSCLRSDAAGRVEPKPAQHLSLVRTIMGREDGLRARERWVLRGSRDSDPAFTSPHGPRAVWPVWACLSVVFLSCSAECQACLSALP